MRILLAQSMLYLPSHGGANKANRIIMESLARQGHECHVVSLFAGSIRSVSATEHAEYLRRVGSEVTSLGEDVVRHTHGGVEVVATTPRRLYAKIRDSLRASEFDVVIVPSDDPGAVVLGAALNHHESPIAYVIHTIQRMPFGPRSFYPSESMSNMVRRTSGQIAVSKAAADYAREWGGLDPRLAYLPIFDPPREGIADSPGSRTKVTFINPCRYKGIDIFLGLASRFPEVDFLAVRSWGTTDEDLARMRDLRNIEVCDSTDDVESIYRQTRVLLMPSLWDETFGCASVEAMQRGIPVIASRIGGLVEAKLGVPFSIPVQAIKKFDTRSADGLPLADVPPQDLDPWVSALESLLKDPDCYQEIANRSRVAADKFTASLSIREFEQRLEEISSIPIASSERNE